jgi:trypsin
MKVLAIIAILFAASEASLIRQPIPYDVYVSLGGLPLPEALRAKEHITYTMEDVYNNSRIVGGSTASSGTYPWVVSMRRSATSSHICGGSILTTRTILTAAHCCDGSSSAAIRYNSLNHGSGGTIISSSRVIIHGSYSSSTINNDVCVIQLASAMTLGQTNAQAVTLATSEPTSGSANVCGWGTTSSGGSTLPSALLHVNVPYVSRATCQSNYGASSITASMICYGQSGRDSCQGDSGGPLTVGNTQVGVVSWGRGCAAAGFPGVYANVAPLRAWINQNTI